MSTTKWNSCVVITVERCRLQLQWTSGPQGTIHSKWTPPYVKMKAVRFFEMSGAIQPITQRAITKERNPQLHRC